MSARLRTILRSTARALLGLGVAALALAVVAAGLGLRVNRSGSLPRGLYRLVERSPRTVARGALVLACPPRPAADLARERGVLHPGTCPGGVAPLGKIVLAIAGDRIEVTPRGLVVDGRFVPASARWSGDSNGMTSTQPPTRARLSLGPGEVWLFAPHPRSFDSRAFGPVRIEALRGLIAPVWTEERVGRAPSAPGGRTARRSR